MNFYRKIVETMPTFLKKYWFVLTFGFIVLLAIVLRFYKLGEVPHGMTWDEAAIGYNGYAIFKTRRDEWLEKLPLSFRSFGDYKAPLAIYLNGVSTFLFGMNLWAVRFPFAVAGVFSVIGMVLLTRVVIDEIGGTPYWYKWYPNRVPLTSLLAGLLMAISPWPLHFSRIGFESGLALCLVIWGSWAFFKATATHLPPTFSLLATLKALITKKKVFSQVKFSTQMVSIAYWFLAITFFALSLYAYHSAKIFTPLLVLLLLWYKRNYLFKNWKMAFVGGVWGMVLSYPLLKDGLSGHGFERAGTLIFNQYHGFELVKVFINQFLAHLQPAFLVLGEAPNLRHGDGQWGVLFPISFFMLIMAILFLFKNIRRLELYRELPFALAWFLLGIVPAALGLELVPHSNRAFLALPGAILLVVLGANYFTTWVEHSRFKNAIKGSHGEKNMMLVSVMGMMILLEGLFCVRYLHHYYTDFASLSAQDFNDGYLEAFNYVVPLEKTKDKILFTDQYGQPYIYALFVRKTNPIWYRGGSLVKYEFGKVTPGDLGRENTVIVAGGDEGFPTAQADKVVYGSDGKVRFQIFVR